jgi:hypothetical protein
MTEDERATKHEEALELAAMKGRESNLARCYLDARDELDRLRTALAGSEAKAATARNDALEKAAKVAKLHIHEECECPICNVARVISAHILALKDIT